MKKNCTTARLINFILIISLIFLCLPAGQVAAKPVPKLAVDVWMDKGGQGSNEPGGQYQLGETITVYFTATIGCQTRLTVSGPGGTSSREQPAMYGPVYQLPIGYGEEVDIGQWHVVLNAVTATGDQTASDTTRFTIVGPPPAPSQPPIIITPPQAPPPAPPPTPPTPMPSPSPGPEPTPEPVSTATRSNVTGLDALKALKMSGGALPPDLALDVDKDGSISKEDARLILRWVVEGRARLALEQHVVEMEMVAPNTWDVPHDLITEVATPNEGAIIKTDDMELSIPAGAVSQDTEVVLKKLKQAPPFLPYKEEYSSVPWAMSFGSVYDFGPEGLEFQEPVKITLSYDENILPVGVDETNIVPVYFNGKDWLTMHAVVDTERNTVSFRTSSFPGQFVTFSLAFLGKLVAVTGVNYAVWKYLGGGEAVVSQWAKDPIYNGKAAEYVQPDDPEVKKYAQKVIAEVGHNKYKSFGSDQELAEILKQPVAGDRLIKFDFGRSKRGPDYKISKNWGDDWLKPADYIKGGMKGDCKNIANFYCSILRNLNFNAKCVDGFMRGGRHVWVEVEVDGKPYYIGDSGELRPLDEAVKQLQLTRPKGVDGQGFMWDETGQVQYRDNWWKQTDLPDMSQFNEVEIRVHVNPICKDYGGEKSYSKTQSADRICRQMVGERAPGRWESPNKFVATWDETTGTPGGISPVQHRKGQITVTFAPGDFSKVTSYVCQYTLEALETRFEPRKRTVAVRGGNIGFKTTISKGVVYFPDSATACDGVHIADYSKIVDYQDGSRSECNNFDCNVIGGSAPGVQILFTRK